MTSSAVWVGLVCVLVLAVYAAVISSLAYFQKPYEVDTERLQVASIQGQPVANVHEGVFITIHSSPVPSIAPSADAFFVGKLEYPSITRLPVKVTYQADMTVIASFRSGVLTVNSNTFPVDARVEYFEPYVTLTRYEDDQHDPQPMQWNFRCPHNLTLNSVGLLLNWPDIWLSFSKTRPNRPDWLWVTRLEFTGYDIHGVVENIAVPPVSSTVNSERASEAFLSQATTSNVGVYNSVSTALSVKNTNSNGLAKYWTYLQSTDASNYTDEEKANLGSLMQTGLLTYAVSAPVFNPVTGVMLDSCILKNPAFTSYSIRFVFQLSLESYNAAATLANLRLPNPVFAESDQIALKELLNRVVIPQISSFKGYYLADEPSGQVFSVQSMDWAFEQGGAIFVSLQRQPTNSPVVCVDPQTLQFVAACPCNQVQFSVTSINGGAQAQVQVSEVAGWLDTDGTSLRTSTTPVAWNYARGVITLNGMSLSLLRYVYTPEFMAAFNAVVREVDPAGSVLRPTMLADTAYFALTSRGTQCMPDLSPAICDVFLFDQYVEPTSNLSWMQTWAQLGFFSQPRLWGEVYLVTNLDTPQALTQSQQLVTWVNTFFQPDQSNAFVAQYPNSVQYTQPVGAFYCVINKYNYQNTFPDSPDTLSGPRFDNFMKLLQYISSKSW